MRRRTSSGCPLATLTHLDTAAKRSVRADAMLHAARQIHRMPYTVCPYAERTKRMRTSSQDSTSCGRQKLLDCSLSTPTLLHHDIAGGDDVRMSAWLPATSYRGSPRADATLFGSHILLTIIGTDTNKNNKIFLY